MTQSDIELPEIVGLDVTAIVLDSSIAISLGAQREFTLRVAAEFSMHRGDQRVQVVFSPFDELRPSGLTELADIATSTVTEAIALATGEIRIQFANNWMLHVEPRPKYEAWTLSGPNGVLVALPSGGLG